MHYSFLLIFKTSKFMHTALAVWGLLVPTASWKLNTMENISMELHQMWSHHCITSGHQQNISWCLHEHFCYSKCFMNRSLSVHAKYGSENHFPSPTVFWKMQTRLTKTLLCQHKCPCIRYFSYTVTSVGGEVSSYPRLWNPCSLSFLSVLRKSWDGIGRICESQKNSQDEFDVGL